MFSATIANKDIFYINVIFAFFFFISPQFVRWLNTKRQKSHRHVMFALFCLISLQFVIISVFFTTEACYFQ